MNRTVKIAAAAGFGGLMMTGATVSTFHPPMPVAAVAAAAPDDGIDTPPADLRRCRTLTMPDAECEATWEAKRRRFFGKDERR